MRIVHKKAVWDSGYVAWYLTPSIRFIPWREKRSFGLYVTWLKFDCGFRVEFS